MPVSRFLNVLALGAALAAPAARAQTLTTLYAFTGGADGAEPVGRLIYRDGVFYGATEAGGSGCDHNVGCGVIFKFDPSTGTETVLHTFDLATGAVPTAIIFSGKNILGVTDGGGNGYGAVFKLNVSTGKYKVLYKFGASPDAANPVSVTEANGTLYGVSRDGGTYDGGAIFKLDPANGIETVLYSFGGGLDADLPDSQLIFENGQLYGTTELSGGGAGTVFSVDAQSGVETILYQQPGIPGGEFPYGDIAWRDGVLYGTTYLGGVHGRGNLYALNVSSGEVTTLASNRAKTGRNPWGVDFVRGVLCGVDYLGGPGGGGAIYKFDAAKGRETLIYGFTAGAGPSSPVGTPISVNGSLYGMAYNYGGKRFGAIYKVTP